MTFVCPIPVPPLTATDAAPLLLLALPFVLLPKPRVAILTLNNTRSYTRSRTSQHEVLSCCSRSTRLTVTSIGSESVAGDSVVRTETRGRIVTFALPVHSFLFKFSYESTHHFDTSSRPVKFVVASRKSSLSFSAVSCRPTPRYNSSVRFIRAQLLESHDRGSYAITFKGE